MNSEFYNPVGFSRKTIGNKFSWIYFEIHSLFKLFFPSLIFLVSGSGDWRKSLSSRFSCIKFCCCVPSCHLGFQIQGGSVLDWGLAPPSQPVLACSSLSHFTSLILPYLRWHGGAEAGRSSSSLSGSGCLRLRWLLFTCWQDLTSKSRAVELEEGIPFCLSPEKARDTLTEGAQHRMG